MSNRKIWGLILTMVIVFPIVLTKFDIVKPVNTFVPNREVKLTILATADLHGAIPTKLAEYVQEERKKDKNLILVDAGDFFDSTNSVLMTQWFRLSGPNSNHQRRTPPIVREMGKLGYDAVVLGNHEFVSNDKDSLDELVLDFTDYGIPVLSANLYETSNYHAHYVNPYIIKEIETEQGIVKVGILGLTIKEVGESNGPRELKDLLQYKGTLELKDIVQEVNSKRWPELLRYNGADIVIAVVHSGEESLKSKDTGNRIKELAQSTDGIDAIVAAHTHVNIPEHKYKNKSGETVIVTQPGRYGEYISKINFVLVKENGRWTVKDKSSLTQKP